MKNDLVHEIIVARREQAQSIDALPQTDKPIQPIAIERPLELASSWRTARNTDPPWRGKRDAGRDRLPDPIREASHQVLNQAWARRQGPTA
jgi:hypothetical protein